MATKKKKLHASKRRSNSSPELQLQMTENDATFERALGPALRDFDSIRGGDRGVKCDSSKKDDVDVSESESLSLSTATGSSCVLDVPTAVNHCSSCGNTRESTDKSLGPSVRPKVRNNRSKIKTEQAKSSSRERRKKAASADRVIMDVDDYSETMNSSSSETEGVDEPTKHPKRQGFGRVASALVARFRHKAPKHQCSISNSDSDSASSAKDIPMESFRPRSKSFSGRIMRRFGTKEKAGRSQADLSRRDLTKRKMSHTSRIQSCIGVIFTGKGTLKQKGKSSKNQTDRPRRYTPVINLEHFNPDDYPIESEDDLQKVLREQEIRDGVEPPPGYQPHFFAEAETHPEPNAKVVKTETNQDTNKTRQASVSASPAEASPVVPGPSHTTANIYDQYGSLTPEGNYIPRTVHTQIDYMHCLVPDQKSIINSSFYWGKIDRFEADMLLENKPEGTFLLRDSAHDEFVFSVSFRRYGRTLHARIEQWKHKFSFDAHDPGVFSYDTICGLLKHYKDPNFCMFFEPMLTIPLPRPNPPSLQELARATICSHTTYDGITHLALPRTLKEYAREYHYKQRVRMRRFEVPEMPDVVEPKIGVITKTCISR